MGPDPIACVLIRRGNLETQGDNTTGRGTERKLYKDRNQREWLQLKPALPTP